MNSGTCTYWLGLCVLGFFWARNMLVVERYHVFFKKLFRGTRNALQSLTNYYNLHHSIQNKWRTSPEAENWAIAEGASSMKNRQSPPDMVKAVKAWRVV